MFQENKIIVRRDHLFTDGATILLHNIHEFILTHNIKEKTRFIDELEEIEYELIAYNVSPTSFLFFISFLISEI